MYRTILIPVDGSETSRVALEHAIALATGLDATVRVLAVVEPGGSPLAFGVDEVEAVNRAIDDLVDTIVAADGRTEVSIRSDVRRGQPVHEVILEYAEESGADLVVLGRQGMSTLPRTILGSTVDRVARRAEVPVTLVPDPNRD